MPYTEAITIYIPYSNVWQCLFSHTLASTNYYPKRWKMISCYVLKTCFSLILRGLEYVFIRLEDISIFFSLTCLFKLFAYFPLVHWSFSNYFNIGSNTCLHMKATISLLSMTVVFKVWFLDQQHQHYRGTCKKCRLSCIIQDLVSEINQFGVFQVAVMYTKVWELLVSDVSWDIFSTSMSLLLAFLLCLGFLLWRSFCCYFVLRSWIYQHFLLWLLSFLA